MRSRVTATVLATALFGLVAAEAAAQTIGTFRWRLAPFCNVLTLTVVQQGGVFQLVGTDDGCASESNPVTGTAFITGPNVRMGFSVIASSGGAHNYSATVSLAGFNGTWADGRGSGPLLFNPASPAPGNPRGPVEAVFAYGQIREDGSIRDRSARVLSVDHPGAGLYCINFTQDASLTFEGTVVGMAGGSGVALTPRVTNGQSPFLCPSPGALQIVIVNTAGVETNGRFSFIVP